MPRRRSPAGSSKEKLNRLIATLDKEITHLKGKRAEFAPHWKSPDKVRHVLKAELPLWVIGSALTCLGLITYGTLSWLLARHTNEALGTYFDTIKLAQKSPASRSACRETEGTVACLHGKNFLERSQYARILAGENINDSAPA